MSLSLDAAVVVGGALLAGAVWWSRRLLSEMSADEAGDFLERPDPGVLPVDAARAESLGSTIDAAGDAFGFDGADGGDAG